MTLYVYELRTEWEKAYMKRNEGQKGWKKSFEKLSNVIFIFCLNTEFHTQKTEILCEKVE